MTKYQFNHARLLHTPTGRVYAANFDRDEVFVARKKGQAEPFHLAAGERPCEAQGGELRRDAEQQDPERSQVLNAMRDIRASQPLLTPGAHHPDAPGFVSCGVIPKREWEQMVGGKPIPAFRPSRATHMELFDLNRDGWVTLSEQLRTWPALGTSKVAAPVKAVITAILFGTKKIGPHFLAINTDEMWRPSGRTGLFRDDGTVNKAIADKVRARFREAGADVLEDGRWISEANFAKIVAEAAGRPAKGVSKRQWKTTFDVIALLNQNGERKIDGQQFEWFLEGSLADRAASMPDRHTGKAPIQSLYHNVMREAAQLKEAAGDAIRLLPASYLLRQFKTYRPEIPFNSRPAGN